MTTDSVFKALADKTRRRLLDLLCEKNGRNLSELCEPLNMSRQAVMKHLGVLERANLIAVDWKGREKLHYFNLIPIQETYGRWIDKLEGQQLRALDSLKLNLEKETNIKKRGKSNE